MFPPGRFLAPLVPLTTPTPPPLNLGQGSVIPPPGWKSSLADSKPPNPLVSAPITLFIGKIPLKMRDEHVRDLLEACGRVQKWSRPSDQKPFGFVTFDNGIAGLRCFNLIDKFDLSKYIPDATEALQVKAGTKEQAILDSLKQIEVEQHQSSPKAEASADTQTDLDAVCRSKISIVLAGIAADLGVRVADFSAELVGGVSPSFVSSITSSTQAQTLATLVDLNSLDPNDPEREKIIKSEIENFRMKKNLRDKDVEDRKKQMRERINQLKEQHEREKKEEARKKTSEQVAAALQLQEERLQQSLRNADIQIHNQPDKSVPQPDEMEVEGDEKPLEQVAREELTSQIQTQIQNSLFASMPSTVPSNVQTSETKSAVTSVETSTNSSSAPSSIKMDIRLAPAKRSVGMLSVGSGIFGVSEEDEGLRRRGLAMEKIEVTEEERARAQTFNAAEEAEEARAALATNAQVASAVAAIAAVVSGKSKSKTLDSSTKTSDNRSPRETESDGKRRDSERDGDRNRDRRRDRSREKRDRSREKDRERRDRSRSREKEKEVRRVRESERGSERAAAPTELPMASAEEDQEKKIQKQIADMIPTDREKLFAFAIDWEVVEKKGIVDLYLRRWIEKKMVEYLGAPDSSSGSGSGEVNEVSEFAEFVVSLLRRRCSPQELLGEVTQLLDRDADAFALKLWRMLIFYALKESRVQLFG